MSIPTSPQEPADFTGEVIRPEAFVAAAVRLVVEEAQRACEQRGHFRLSLCGGSTPKPVYEALADHTGMPWELTLITFGDERCVGPEHDRSNYRMAHECFLGRTPIPPDQILRMEGEREPGEAATRYEEALRRRAEEAAEPIFRHDLILLGMGDDGHTASLFPGTTALKESHRWVVANEVPKFDEHRITFTYPLINAARHVCFLVTGANKRPVYERIFAGDRQDPAAHVSPESGKLTWMVG